MLSNQTSFARIEKQLSLLIEQQTNTTNAITVMNRKFVGFEQTFVRIARYTQESLTYIKRLQPYLASAMKTLHEAFRLVANGIWNLRDETESFAGTINNYELDVNIV